jgi:2-keto-4-pentenoate hydratase/2-oxohepta-3-ene-1,7-dioic acid hydratase in catechol pathway
VKLLRFGPVGQEKPGLLDADGRIRDLSTHVSDISGAAILPEGLERLKRLNPGDLPLVEGTPRLGPCVAGSGKFVCIGLNYSDHAAETGARIPKEPILFLKAISALNGPNDDIVIPRGAVKTDWEVELGVVIGTRASYVNEQEALDHVAGYCIVNDVSEREYQSERGGLWDKGKGCDSFAPVGPWLVTREEIADPQNLKLSTEVNGVRRQDGNTRTMIFDVRTLVSYISHFMTLLPGDLIATGTPPGVALGMKPPQYLKEGDTLRLSVEGLGEQNNRLVAWSR